MTKSPFKQGKAALHQFGPEAAKTLAFLATGAATIFVKFPAGNLIAMPAPSLIALSFRNVGGNVLCGIDFLDKFSLVIALVGYHTKKFRRLVAKGLEVVFDSLQSFGDTSGVALIGWKNADTKHGAGFQVDRMFGFVGQMGRTVLHPGDAGIRVGL